MILEYKNLFEYHTNTTMFQEHLKILHASYKWHIYSKGSGATRTHEQRQLQSLVDSHRTEATNARITRKESRITKGRIGWGISTSRSAWRSSSTTTNPSSVAPAAEKQRAPLGFLLRARRGSELCGFLRREGDEESFGGKGRG